MANGTRKQKPCTKCGGRRLVRCIKEGKPCTRCGHLETTKRTGLGGGTLQVDGYVTKGAK